MFKKIQGLIKSIKFKTRQKLLFLELEKAVKKGKTYLKFVGNDSRGIGKSYTLVQLADKYDLPIVVKYSTSKGHLDKISYELYGYPVEVIRAGENHRGKRYKTILVEEGLEHEDFVKLIPVCNNFVGFKNDRLL